jgi:hypothetical protein
LPFGNSIRAVVGDRLVWGGPQLEEEARLSTTGHPTGQPASVVRTTDVIDYWIRRQVHATDFSNPWSPPPTPRRSRVNDAHQSKLIPARDRSVWLSIGRCLKLQYDALAAPIPPHIAALVEQLETQK